MILLLLDFLFKEVCLRFLVTTPGVLGISSSLLESCKHATVFVGGVTFLATKAGFLPPTLKNERMSFEKNLRLCLIAFLNFYCFNYL